MLQDKKSLERLIKSVRDFFIAASWFVFCWSYTILFCILPASQTTKIKILKTIEPLIRFITDKHPKITI